MRFLCFILLFRSPAGAISNWQRHSGWNKERRRRRRRKRRGKIKRGHPFSGFLVGVGVLLMHTCNLLKRRETSRRRRRRRRRGGTFFPLLCSPGSLLQQQQMSQHTTKPSSSSPTSSTLFHLPLILSTFEGLLYFSLSLFTVHQEEVGNKTQLVVSFLSLFLSSFSSPAL